MAQEWQWWISIASNFGVNGSDCVRYPSLMYSTMFESTQSMGNASMN